MVLWNGRPQESGCLTSSWPQHQVHRNPGALATRRMEQVLPSWNLQLVRKLKVWGNQPGCGACWFSLLSTACPELCRLLFSRGSDKLQMGEHRGFTHRTRRGQPGPLALLGENRWNTWIKRGVTAQRNLKHVLSIPRRPTLLPSVLPSLSHWWSATGRPKWSLLWIGVIAGVSGAGRGYSIRLTSRGKGAALMWALLLALRSAAAWVLGSARAYRARRLPVQPHSPLRWTEWEGKISQHTQSRRTFDARLVQSPAGCLASLTFVGID